MKFDQLDPSLVAAVDMMHQNCFDLVMMTRITQAGPFMTKKIFVLPVFFFFLYLFLYICLLLIQYRDKLFQLIRINNLILVEYFPADEAMRYACVAYICVVQEFVRATVQKIVDLSGLILTSWLLQKFVQRLHI